MSRRTQCASNAASAVAAAAPWALLVLLSVATLAAVTSAAPPPAGMRVSQSAGRRVDPAPPQHRVVHGGPPCSRNAYLAPTPTSVERFVADVERGPDVYLLRIRNDEYLPCRILASTWEKIIVVLKDKVRIVELHLNRDPAAKAIARYLNMTDGNADLPYLSLYYGRPAAPERRDAHARDLAVVAAAGGAEGDDRGQRAGGASTTCTADEPGADGNAAGRGCEGARIVPPEALAAARERIAAVEAEPRGVPGWEVLVTGKGTSHAMVREAVETRIKALHRDAGGRSYKRDIW